jgi:murein DD-endopeptidase MepM/ murein hydrolase activator NlpD
VLATADNIPDNEFVGKQINTPELPAGADPELGNYVLIDHHNGEFSVFPHMMPGSVLVKAGDAVHQGEMIGRVGFSGDAIFPHVLYSLLSGPDIYRFEGLPAYFTRFRLRGRLVDVQRGTIDSGDILESSAKYLQASPGH